MSQGFGAPKGFGRRQGTDAVTSNRPFTRSVVEKPAKFSETAPVYLDDPGVQSVMREFETCVLVLVLVMSVINRPDPSRIVHYSLTTYRQPAVTRFPVMQPILEDHGMPEDHVEALEDFHQAFALAVPFIREVTDDMPNGFDRSWIVDASLLLFAASKAAVKFISMVPGVHGLCEAAQGGLAPAAELEAALRGTIRGEAPYWFGNGPSLPDWQMKRNACRHTLNSPGKLIVGDTSEDVVVTNVSRLGFGLTPAPKCETGTEFKVRLESGREIHARLGWKENNSAGASFINPISLDDPLIAVT